MTCPSMPPTGRSSASSGPTAPGRRRSSTWSRASSAPTTGWVRVAGLDVTDRSASTPGQARTRPVLPGLAALLCSDGARRTGGVAGALHRRRGPVQRHLAPARAGPHGGGGDAPRRGAAGALRAGALRRQPGQRALDRISPARRPRRRRCPPAVGDPARRALVRRRPTRGRGHGGPLAQRARAARTRPCSSSSTTLRSLPSSPTVWWRWTAAQCSPAAIHGHVLSSREVGESFLGSDPLALSRRDRLGPVSCRAPSAAPTRGRPHVSEPEPTRGRRGRGPRVPVRIAGPVVLIVAALIAAGVSATVSENRSTADLDQCTSTGDASPRFLVASVPLTYAAAVKIGEGGGLRLGIASATTRRGGSRSPASTHRLASPFPGRGRPTGRAPPGASPARRSISSTTSPSLAG